jgi:hypothetical protein
MVFPSFLLNLATVVLALVYPAYRNFKLLEGRRVEGEHRVRDRRRGRTSEKCFLLCSSSHHLKQTTTAALSLVSTSFFFLILTLSHFSHRNLSLPNPQNAEEYNRYWIVLSFVLAAERLLEPLLSSLLPAYYELKLFLVLFLYSARTDGAKYVYDRFLKPRLVQHEKQIDESLEHYTRSASDLFNQTTRK